MFLTKFIRAATALIAASVLLQGQAIAPGEITFRKTPYTPRAEVTFKSDTTLVEVGAVVRNNLGHTVPGLVKENFQILENGKPHEITSFTVQTSPVADKPAAGPVPSALKPAAVRRPRYVALVMDDILLRIPSCPACNGVQMADWQIMQTAAKRYVREGLVEGDRVSLLGLYYGQLLDFTTDTEKIAAAIGNATVTWQDPIQKMSSPAETLGSLEDVVEYLGKMPGDRILVLASGGLRARNSSWEQGQLISQALRAGVIIHCIDRNGLAPAPVARVQPMTGRLMPNTGGRPDWWQSSDDMMARISESTGGEYFHDNNSMLRGLRETIAPDVKYLLGFQQPDVHDGLYHPLKVRLAGTPHYEVIARPGYLAPAADEQPPAPAEAFDRAVTADTDLTGLGASITASQGKDSPSGPSLHAVAHLNLKSVAFHQEADQYQQQITYIAVLYDSHGSYVAGGKSVIDLNLTAPNFERLKEAGINFSLDLGAPPGTYRLRSVVQDKTGQIASASQPVEIQ
jgi:VWFA-related protein